MLQMWRGQVVEIVTMWDNLSEHDKGPLSYPPRHRVLKGRFKVSHSAISVTPGTESLKCCFLGEGSGPAQWPNESSLVEAICLALCRIYPAGQTIAGVKVNRHNSRKKRQEREALQQNVEPFTAPLMASELLPPVLSKLPAPIKH